MGQKLNHKTLDLVILSIRPWSYVTSKLTILIILILAPAFSVGRWGPSTWREKCSVYAYSVPGNNPGQWEYIYVPVGMLTETIFDEMSLYIRSELVVRTSDESTRSKILLLTKRKQY